MSGKKFIDLKQTSKDLTQLIALLHDPQAPTWLRVSAAYLLGYGCKIGVFDKEITIGTLVKGLGDKNESIRNSSAFALSMVGEQAIPHLIAQLEGRLGDPEMSKLIISTLERMAKSERGKVKVAKVLTDMIGGGVSRSVQETAARAIVELKPRVAVTYLMHIAENRELPLDTRCLAIETLGNLGDLAKSAVPKLSDILDEKNLELCCATMSALSRIRDKSALPKMIETYNEFLKEYEKLSKQKPGSFETYNMGQALNSMRLSILFLS